MDNIIAPEFAVDHQKVSQNLVRQIENRPTTKIVLTNRSSIISRVVLNYKDVAAVDPYSVDKLIYKKFNLVYDILPREKVEIVVPCAIVVKITVCNDIYKKKRQKTINTGSVFGSNYIDATPPGAMECSKDKTKTIYITNNSGHIGEVKVENRGGFTEHEIDLKKTESEKTVNVHRKVLRLPEKPYFVSILPGRTERIDFKNGIYRISMSGNKFKRKLFLQVSNGRFYDKRGNRIFLVLEIPRQAGDPGPYSIPVKVPNK